jgi:tRNA-dihydrouridine synthase B
MQDQVFRSISVGKTDSSAGIFGHNNITVFQGGSGRIRTRKCFELIFNAAYEFGYAWTTVHCRTVVQKYQGPSKWPFLTDLVKRHPDKLIFGSGDIWDAGDIFRMIDATGVHAVSVARGCIGNPWIFTQARQLMAGAPGIPEEEALAPPTIEEQRAALLDHFELCMALHGEQGASRMMRKFGIKFSAHHPEPETIKQKFIRCKSVADWKAVLDEHYAAHVMA